MNGYVANTDYDWYAFLAARPPLDEVNFWQPGGGNQAFRALKPGEPFFFRLKQNRNVVAGFGWFARHERNVRSSLAWEAFGIKNGAPDLAAMRRRISRYRETLPAHPDDPDVGCLMIAQPTFFPPEQWIAQPNDFQQNIVQGKTYDMMSGEGRRIYEACIRAAASSEMRGAAQVAEEHARYGEPTLVRPRLGQGIFRIALDAAYEGACAVTNEHSEPVLEAAHIRPFSLGGPHQIDNGLLLRSDVHKLFDLGYVTVTPNHIFAVSPRLSDAWHNGRTYYAFDGKPIRVPRSVPDRPDPALLAWHNQNVFRR
jgi:putative restriction endonuclease